LDPESAFSSLTLARARDTAAFHDWHMGVCRRRYPPPGMKPTEESFLRTLAVWEWAVETALKRGGRALQFLSRQMGSKKPWIGWGNKQKTDAEHRLKAWRAARGSGKQGEAGGTVVDSSGAA